MPAAFAPGRVNLIGDHTDYTGGLALPMAIQLGTTVNIEPGGAVLALESEAEADEVEVALDMPGDLTGWGRYVGGVVAEVHPEAGGRGTVTTTLPVGAGLSSSAALEVALALALGFDGSELDLALACQRAEQRAAGVPCGLMDQLASAAGVKGHALLMDCRTNEVTPVPVPEEVEIRAVPSGESRQLAGSAYADRRRECERAESCIGPLRDATESDLGAVPDPVARRRARHVVTENERVLLFSNALQSGDIVGAGRLMRESHESLRHDFEVSTPALDRLVGDLNSRPGVHGARLTGAGFGGCCVVLCDPGAVEEGWLLTPSEGAHRL